MMMGVAGVYAPAQVKDGKYLSSARKRTRTADIYDTAGVDEHGGVMRRCGVKEGSGHLCIGAGVRAADVYASVRG